MASRLYDARKKRPLLYFFLLEQIDIYFPKIDKRITKSRQTGYDAPFSLPLFEIGQQIFDRQAPLRNIYKERRSIFITCATAESCS